MKTIKKVIYYTTIVILSFFLIINSYLLIMRYGFGDTLPKIFGYSHAIVVSGSMEPTLEVGDIVYFKQEDSYAINDVVIFNQGNTYVTHRIVEEVENGFITKGDANNVVDSDVLLVDNIQGSYIYKISSVGNIFTFFTSPLGVFIVFVLGIGLYEVPIWYASRRRR